MTQSAHVIALYGALAARSDQMLDAARRADWDRLIGIERDYHALAVTLVPLDASMTGADDAYAHTKEAFLRKLLADEAEIRRLTVPRLHELAIQRDSACREFTLRRAYGPDHER